MRVVVVALAVALAVPAVLGTEIRPRCGSACREAQSAPPPAASAPRLLVALDQRDGTVLWRVKPGGTGGGHLDARFVTHGLVIAEERRCLSGERAYQPGDASLVAFDARTGRLRWRAADVEPATGLFGRIDPPGPSVTTVPVRSPVTGDDELLDVGSGRVAGPLDAQPVAASGDLLLTVARDAPTASASTRGIVTAIDRRTGAPRWTRNLGANLFSVVAETGAVAVAAGPIPDPGTDLGKLGGVEVLDPVTGQRRWAAALMPAYGLTLAAGRVVLQNLDRLRAVDASTGQVAWEATTDATVDPDLVPDHMLVVIGGPGTGGSVGTLGGSVAVFDATTGTRRWTRTTTGVPIGYGADTRTVVAGSDRRIVAFDAAHGRTRWRRSTPAHARSVVAGGGRVYVSGGCTVSNE